MSRVEASTSTLSRRVAVRCMLLPLVVSVILLLVPPFALADTGRTYQAQIPLLEEPSSVTFDSAGNSWIAQGQAFPSVEEGVFKYGPYPSLTEVATLTAYPPPLAGALHLYQGLAFSEATDELFLAHSNGRKVEIFNDNGVFQRDWPTIDENLVLVGQGDPVIRIAADNSDSYSRGRIYLSLRAVENYASFVPSNTVEAFDAAERPVDFPATASYIEDNKLTGTPSGPFGEVQYIAVDANGDIFVVDVDHNVVDEFDSTGTFLRGLSRPKSSVLRSPPENDSICRV